MDNDNWPSFQFIIDFPTITNWTQSVVIKFAETIAELSQYDSWISSVAWRHYLNEGR